MTEWTNERIDLLTRYVNEGKPASEIAPLLSPYLTRNAVIGKATRLGLQLRGVGGKRNGAIRAASGPRHQPRAARMVKRKAPKPVHYLEAAAAAVDLPADQSRFACTLLDLTHQTCRWPLGDPAQADFRFCGAPKHGELSYCARHCAMAFQPYQRRALTEEEKQRRATTARANFRMVPA